MSNAVKRRARAQQPQGEQEAGYSGRLLLRMSPMLHSELARLAEERGVSLNQLITTLLAEAVSGEPDATPERPASPRLTRIALAVNIAVVAFAGLLAVGLLAVALSDAL